MPSRSLNRSAAVWFAAASLFAGPGANTAFASRVPDALTVFVIDNNGNNVPAPITYYLVGPTSIAISSLSNPFVFSSISAGSYHVRVWALGYCLADQPVTVSGASSVTVILTHSCSDSIDTGFGDPVIAFMRGKASVGGAPTCLNDSALPGSGPLLLLQNMLAPAGSPTCHVEVALLSKDHAFWFFNDPAAVPWTNATGDRLVAALGPPLAVPMRILVLSGGGSSILQKMGEIRDIHLERADGLLADSYAGLVLGDSPSVGPEIDDLTATHPELLSAVGNGCDAVVSIMSHSELYDQGHLNVFYVDHIVSTSSAAGGPAGVSCVAQGAPNIIFISANESGPFILMHEVGHALGLTRPNAGHTPNMSGFRFDANGVGLDVMDSWSDIAARYLSVGQIIQMHLSDGSWLNLPSGSGGSTVRGRAAAPLTPFVEACGCPETQPTLNCPPLSLDILRDGTLSSAPMFFQVCSISVTPPAGTIGCTSDTQVLALFYQGANAARAGERLWFSDSPILSASLDNFYTSPLGTRGLLRGVKTGSAPVSGTATVKVWADGTVTSFPVTVSCP